LRAQFRRIRQGDYVAFNLFFDQSEDRDRSMRDIRALLRERFRVATTADYGPRLLHSTGQLHKGGPDTGVFVELTADDGEDLPIPGQPFGFATLAKAQALGDFDALVAPERRRRAIRIHVERDLDSGLSLLRGLIADAVRS
jgi:transaldolase/glucose-6-phosphate isomerase